MDVLLLILIILFILFVVGGAFIHILWIVAVICVVVWLLRLIFGGSRRL